MRSFRTGDELPERERERERGKKGERNTYDIGTVLELLGEECSRVLWLMDHNSLEHL